MNLLLLLGIVIFFSASVNSCFGFGDAMINMAVLSFFMSFEELSPLVALLAVSSTIFISIMERKHIAWKNILLLVSVAILFAPLGIFLTQITDGKLLKTSLGLIICFTALYNLRRPKLGIIKSKVWTYFFGALAGIMGGAFNTSGAPVVFYATLRQWEAKEFRANLQAFFLPLESSIVLGHIYFGNIGEQVLGSYLSVFPILVVGIFLGKWLNRQIKDIQSFNRYVYILLIILGLSLLF